MGEIENRALAIKAKIDAMTPADQLRYAAWLLEEAKSGGDVNLLRIAHAVLSRVDGEIHAALMVERTRKHAQPRTEARGAIAGDGPTCTECGHLTVRNGACYRCLNCGASQGCS